MNFRRENPRTLSLGCVSRRSGFCQGAVLPESAIFLACGRCLGGGFEGIELFFHRLLFLGNELLADLV